MRRILQVTSIALLTVFFLGLFLWKSNLHEVWRIMKSADLLWLVLRAVIDLRLTGAVSPIDDLDDEELRRRARIRTLLPVLRNFLFIFVLIIASLSALAAMGLQIGPLLAGAGVVGIAVGFGAQTLVRDVLSGVRASSRRRRRCSDAQ